MLKKRTTPGRPPKALKIHDTKTSKRIADSTASKHWPMFFFHHGDESAFRATRKKSKLAT